MRAAQCFVIGHDIAEHFDDRSSPRCVQGTAYVKYIGSER